MGGFLVIWSTTNFRIFLNYFDTTQCNLISGQSIPWYLLPSIFLLLSKDNSGIFHISKENIVTIAVNWQAIFATLVRPCSLIQMEAKMTCHLSQISLKPRLCCCQWPGNCSLPKSQELQKRGVGSIAVLLLFLPATSAFGAFEILHRSRADVKTI